MKYKLLTLVFLLSIISLASCQPTEKYTVTWKNDNGGVLETDTDVLKGTMPTYDGQTPIKIGDTQYTYTFSNWSPTITEVTGDITYVATYTSSINTYTITWKNYDGTILETDSNVEYGTIPTYDGLTPSKTASEGKRNIFAGWTPSISEVVGDATYTATFIEIDDSVSNDGSIPVFTSDLKTVEYGLYPQTQVSDDSLINQLSLLQPSSINGWYEYYGQYYVKKVAKVYNNEKYAFDSGTEIVNGTEYWFKCEPIKWQVLNAEDGTFMLLSTMLLDTQIYYSNYDNREIDNKTIHANNYEHSFMRTWLNSDFYNTAFAINNTYIQSTIIDNSSSTSDSLDNQYSGTNTTDKVYLPSYIDYLNSAYGFDTNSTTTSSTRCAKTTDYARASGAWVNTSSTLENNGTYWTRTPTSEYYYAAWNVNSGGYLSQYGIDGTSHCVRPCISIRLT